MDLAAAPSFPVVAEVARYHGEPVIARRGGDDEIRL